MKNIVIIKHVEHEGPGSIADFFRNTAFGLKTIELGKGEPLPKTLSNIAAVMVMGGPMNVYEEKKFPFLQEEDVFIKAVLEKGLPYLGICLGSQLLAKACGAQVTSAPEKEIGWYKVTLTAEARQDPVFSNMPKELEVFQWHGDMFSIPPNGVLLAYSPVCNQAFRYGKNAYGLQFHVEINSDIVWSWLKKDKTVEKDVLILAETYRKFPALASIAEIMYENFAGLIA